MPWLEFRITTIRDNVGPLELALEAAGALSITLEDSADTPIFEPALGETPLWQNTQITGLFEASVDTREIAAQIPLDRGSHSHWHLLEDKDWEREWMKTYKPIRCADNLWICPSWCEPPAPEAVNILLDPGLAFGTGTHPTTFMCLQWLAKQPLKAKSVLDYGCGSGILGIAALLLGASSAAGVDIDPQAVLASRENAKRNKIKPQGFPVCLPHNLQGQPADVVVANILAGPLVSLAPVIKPLIAPNGLLCLSGVLATQAEEVMQAYDDTIGFNPIVTQGEWACISGHSKI